jgi:hypothetical protein
MTPYTSANKNPGFGGTRFLQFHWGNEDSYFLRGECTYLYIKLHRLLPQKTVIQPNFLSSEPKISPFTKLFIYITNYMTTHAFLTTIFQFREVPYILSTPQFAEAKMNINLLCLAAPYAVKTHGVVKTYTPLPSRLDAGGLSSLHSLYRLGKAT